MSDDKSEESPAIDAQALRLIGTMLRFCRTVSRSVRRSTETDLSLTDIGVLNLVYTGIDLPSQVARELKLDPPRVTRITDHLVQLGFITREDDPDDRRRSRLRLTPEGMQHLKESLSAVSQAVDGTLDLVSTDLRLKLIDGMTALRVVVDGVE